MAFAKFWQNFTVFHYDSSHWFPDGMNWPLQRGHGEVKLGHQSHWVLLSDEWKMDYISVCVWEPLFTLSLNSILGNLNQGEGEGG